MTWQFVLTGLLVGTLVGATGMGGGSLMTPILVVLLGFNPVTAVGTDIAHGALFKTVGAIRHRRLGTVSGQLSGWMFLGSAPMSLLGVAVSTHLGGGRGTQGPAGIVLGIALLLGGCGLLMKSVVGRRVIVREPFVLTRRDKVAAVLIGVLGGFVVGLTSVGSGVFFGLTLLVAFPLKTTKVVGTDLLHAAGLLWVAGMGHLVAGNVDVHAVGWLLLGSIPGVLLGSEWSVRVKEGSVRVALAAILVLSGFKLAAPSGWLWLFAGLGLLSTISIVALGYRRRRRAPGPALPLPTAPR